MALSLSKKTGLFAALLFSCSVAFSQVEEHDPTDYKDPKQFEKFSKRRVTIAAWQIKELKTGALVVRLKTNQKLIDALRAEGNTKLAEDKELEQYVINKNTMMAYRDYIRFCKVYFIYSNSSDSLLNNTKSGIFLDTNMTINPAIKMTENFYMLAERDYAYNSSIGFVREDSVKTVRETGNPIKEMPIVIKNKYGHQAKGPFPYFVKEKSSVGSFYTVPVFVKNENGKRTVRYTVNKTYLQDLKDASKKAKTIAANEGATNMVKIEKEMTYEKMAAAVDQLNTYFMQFYQSSPKVDPELMEPDIKPFLY